jgi:predicted DNA-binding transcriptional regulator AlpA
VPTPKLPTAITATAKKGAAALKKAEANPSPIAAKFAAANKAAQAEAALTTQTAGQPAHDRKRVHAPRGPPSVQHDEQESKKAATAARKAAAKKAAHVRLLDKDEVCAIAGASFPTIWAWMRTGTFPRSRVVGGKSKWLSTEIEAWVQGLPVRRLKGDAEPAPAETSSGRPLRQRRGGTTL